MRSVLACLSSRRAIACFYGTDINELVAHALAINNVMAIMAVWSLYVSTHRYEFLTSILL